MATKEKNEYLKNGVLYRNDMRVGEDGMNKQERSDKKKSSPDAPVGDDVLALGVNVRGAIPRWSQIHLLA